VARQGGQARHRRRRELRRLNHAPLVEEGALRPSRNR
jgi:hypothetical protein